HDADDSYIDLLISMDGRDSTTATARSPHPIPNKCVNTVTVISLVITQRDHFDFLMIILINTSFHHVG
ncbi:TPA: hypothetical protein ACN7RO_005964, partial [Klebsiella pneumoniae]